MSVLALEFSDVMFRLRSGVEKLVEGDDAGVMGDESGVKMVEALVLGVVVRDLLAGVEVLVTRDS